MDPNADKVPGLGLPPSLAGQGGHSAGAVAAQPVSASADTGLTSAVGTLPVTSPLPQPHQLQPTPAVASEDSTDDLDQEWVNKAKAIIEKTKGDPFLEVNELSKVKAEYLKIRYNKDSKIAEDRSQ